MMTCQNQRPSTSASTSSEVPSSFTGLKPLILAKTSSSSSPRQQSLKSFSNRHRKSSSGVLGYGGNDGGNIGLGPNSQQSQRRSTSTRQPKKQMIISCQLSPAMGSELGLGFSPSTFQVSLTSPAGSNNRARRTRSETFRFPLPPNCNLDNRVLSLTNHQIRYQSLDVASSTSSSRESSPDLRTKHHRRETMITQDWKNDVQSWINERSPSDFGNAMEWSEIGQEKERIRLHLEAQAQLGGRQGWSPETESSCSFRSQTIGLGFESEASHSVTAPLFSAKPNTLKHRDSEETVASSIRSWAFSTAAASGLETSEKVNLAPPSYSSNFESMCDAHPSKQSQEINQSKRRSRSNSVLPPAYADAKSTIETSEKEAQEYPFPAMPDDLTGEEAVEAEDSEDEKKLRRLNESFLLLGHLSDQQELEGHASEEEDKDAQLPHEGLGDLLPFVNPFALNFDSNREYTAPSLAEQMAYACGSGMGYHSVDEEEKLGWEARGICTQLKQDLEIHSSEEDDVCVYNEESAEVESSWSAGAEPIQSWDQVESEDEIFWRSSQSSGQLAGSSSQRSASSHYRLGQGLGRSGALRRNPTGASVRTASVFSHSSTSSSPILSGILAAPRARAVTYGYQGERSPIDIDSLFSRPLSLEIEQGETFGQEENTQVRSEHTEDGNESLFDDFAYLLDDSISDFKVSEEEVDIKSGTIPINLNVLIQPSPALSTPSLDMLQTPDMLSGLPTPVLKGQKRVEGLPSMASGPALPFQSPVSPPQQTRIVEEAGMPLSGSASSNLSVLDRPRPFSRSGLGSEYIQVPKKVRKSPSTLSQTIAGSSSLLIQPSTSSSLRLLPSSASPEIPVRRSFFEENKSEVVVGPPSSKTQNSPTAYFEESRKALVKDDAQLKVNLEELVSSRRSSQIQLPVPAPSPSASRSTPSGRKGLFRNKLSVAALRGLVSAEKEIKKPVASVSMKPSISSDSNFTTSSFGRSSISNASRPKSILSSSSSSSRNQSSRSSQPVIKGSELEAIRRSCADKTAFIKAAAIRAQNQPEHFGPTSRSVASSSASILTKASIQSDGSDRSHWSGSSDCSASSSSSLPALCVARTHSQRRRGETGLPETTRSRLSRDDDILKKSLNVNGKGVTIGLARTKSGRVRELRVEDDRRLPERLKELKQARRVSQVEALIRGNAGEDRTLPMPPPQGGVLIVEENSKEVVQVMVKF